MFTILTLTAVVAVFYSLTLLDSIVTGSLYHYGLEFSYDWANPYWTTYRIAQALLGLAVALTLVSTIYVFKKYGNTELRVLNIETESKIPKIDVKKPKNQKHEKKLTLNEKSTMSPTTIEHQSSGILPGMVKCGHCGRIFAQPLRMLDFHDDRPKMVNICPFCNEIIKTAPNI